MINQYEIERIYKLILMKYGFNYPKIYMKNLNYKGFTIRNMLYELILKAFKKDLIQIFRFPFAKIKKMFYIGYFIIRIKNFRKNYSLRSLIDFATLSFEGMIKPQQKKSEILELLKILKKIKPKFILEIGTAEGGTLFLTTRIATKDAIIISVDLPGGKYGGGYKIWRIPLYKSFALPKQKVHLIRANSHNIDTFKKVKTILNGNKLDYLYIDGDHTYEGVKKDFEMYRGLVKDQGFIAFHDIVFHDEFLDVGVDKFWNEIKVNYTHKEFVENWKQGGLGIGVLENNK